MCVVSCPCAAAAGYLFSSFVPYVSFMLLVERDIQFKLSVMLVLSISLCLPVERVLPSSGHTQTRFFLFSGTR